MFRLAHSLAQRTYDSTLARKERNSKHTVTIQPENILKKLDTLDMISDPYSTHMLEERTSDDDVVIGDVVKIGM